MRQGVRAAAAGLVALALLSGCGAPAGTDEVTRTAAEWLAAARSGDATRLCALLSPAAAESAATGDETCAQAVGDLDLPGAGPLGPVELWGDRAQVHAGTDTLFLIRLSGGWRVDGAGCTARPDRPYDCDVAS